MVRVAAMRRLGLDVPEAQWHRYVGTIYTRARSRYAYPPYEGDVVIFSATDAAATETLSSWRELVRGRLHVETFEGAHLDFTMDAELFARWATRLGAILADGQMDTGDGAGESTLRVARPAEGAADDRGVSEDRQRRAVIGTHG
jgi:hypothetical protein